MSMKLFSKKTLAVFILLTTTLLFSCEKSPDNIMGNKIDPMIAKALAKQGYNISNGELIVNNKVKSTIKLNLSSSNISTLNGLEYFSALEELDLSSNKFSNLDIISFSKLFNANLSIKKLDLKDNSLSLINLEHLQMLEYLDISQNEHLVHIEGFSAKSHDKLKLVKLPYSLRNDMDVIYNFYENKSSNVEMLIEDFNRQLVAYTSLRDIPDDVFRAFLIKKYPEVFSSEEKFDLSKNFEIDEETKPDKHNWSNGPFSFDPRFFDVKGIKSFEGIQYFKHLIKILYAYNIEVEHLDLSNAEMLEELNIGSNVTSYTDLDLSPNSVLKTININGCAKLKTLVVDGLTSKIDLSGLTSLKAMSFNINVEELDFSNCSMIEIIQLKRHATQVNDISKLKKIEFPIGDKWEGLKLLALSYSPISVLDFSKIKANEFFGVAFLIEQCPNLKTAKINHKLGSSTSLRNGSFENIDLRGAKMWNSNLMKWVDASTTYSIYSGNTKLKTLNGKPYEMISSNKSIVVNVENFKQWTYLFLDENGELKVRDIDTYPSENNDETGEDDKWRERTNWDFAIHHNDIRTNSGASSAHQGSGVGIIKLDETDIDAIADFSISNIELDSDVANQKMILSLSSMPPPSTRVPMSIHKSFSMSGMPPTFIPTPEVFLLVTSKKQKVLVKFVDFYDSNRTQGIITIEYKKIK